jgi:hypothetical protein
MSIPGSVNPLFLGAAGQATGEGGYLIERSLRFNSPDSAYLSRTPASAGNRKTWTWAGWVKRCKLGTAQGLFTGNAGASDTAFTQIRFDGATNGLVVEGWSAKWRITSAVYRDTSAWMHIVLAFDTTQGTADNRIKLYVNGAQVTAFATNNAITQNNDGGVNAAATHYISSYNGSADLSDFYLADIHFIDGQALDPTSFGEFDDNGIWQPKAYSGDSYGTNGFQLKFEDNSSNTATTLGKDTSGNGHNWTPVNLSTTTGGPTSVAAASGALPVYNTTGTYGDTKGTGTRTDSNSSSIVLAIPMDGANNGTTFTDEHATIKGSGSAKSITRTNAVTSTAQSKYYGSSGYFDGNNDYLSIPDSADFDFGTGDYTIEAWLYATSFAGSGGSAMRFYAQSTGGGGGGNGLSITILDSGAIRPDANGVTLLTSSQTLKLNGWIHCAVVRNSGTTTVYINGFGSGSTTTSYNVASSSSVLIGAEVTGGGYYAGYMNDLRVYKGVAKYTGNFNPPSSTQNATIAAGNDSLVDVPVNGAQTDTGAGGEVRGNYATLNPLLPTLTPTNGNLDTPNSVGQNYSTIAVATGKWYIESTVGPITTETACGLGVHFNPSAEAGAGYYDSGAYIGLLYSNVLDRYEGVNSAVSNSVTASSGSILAIRLDLDSGTQAISYYVNNVLITSSNLPAGKTWFITTRQNNNQSLNFGQRPFAYTAPSGFKALNTANLPAPLVTKPSTVFDTKLYTGNGSTQTISGLEFSPDLVWVKTRSFSYSHRLSDIVRGTTKYLVSNSSDGEVTDATTLTSFNSDGFSVGSEANYNESAKTYVAWAWDAGSSTVTNTQGSITSSVRTNNYLSVVTYTGNGSGGATFGHGLGVSPAFVIFKCRSQSYGWLTYHVATGNSTILLLESTSAQITGRGDFLNSTTPSSTLITLGDTVGINQSGQTYVAYCWAPLAGYSSAFSFTGNGSTDGPMCYLGFRPRLILLKRTDSTGDWLMVDTANNTYNLARDYFYSNSSSAMMTYNLFDILSNGFKLRDNFASWNASGGTYVGFAWAEHPFQYSRAR